MTVTLHTKFQLPAEVLTQAQSESTRTLKSIYVLRETDPNGTITYALSESLPDLNTPRKSHVATVEPELPSIFKDQLAHISTSLGQGKTICVAVPNQEAKATVRRELALPKDLVIIGDHPDVTFFGHAWLIFIYTTLQNSLRDRSYFDIVYYVKGMNLTPLAAECETENLALLEGYSCPILKLDFPQHASSGSL